MTLTRLRIAVATTAVATAGALGVTALPVHADTQFSTATKTVTRDPSPMPYLVGIRTGRHATFDRVVFDLSGLPSGYKVGYVNAVRADPSDRIVSLAGRYKILVRLIPAAAHNVSGKPTYAGPSRLSVGYPELRQLALAGDFEGVVSIGLGLSHRTGFRVLTLRNPTRIVVDLHH